MPSPAGTRRIRPGDAGRRRRSTARRGASRIARPRQARARTSAQRRQGQTSRRTRPAPSLRADTPRPSKRRTLRVVLPQGGIHTRSIPRALPGSLERRPSLWMCPYTSSRAPLRVAPGAAASSPDSRGALTTAQAACRRRGRYRLRALHDRLGERPGRMDERPRIVVLPGLRRRRGREHVRLSDVRGQEPAHLECHRLRELQRPDVLPVPDRMKQARPRHRPASIPVGRASRTSRRSGTSRRPCREASSRVFRWSRAQTGAIRPG